MDKKNYFTPEAKFRAFIMKDIVATDGSDNINGGSDNSNEFERFD